jgi:hypothetical protein
MYYLGIDPGKTGAAVGIKNDTVDFVAYWRPCQRKKKQKYRLEIKSFRDDDLILDSLSGVSETIRSYIVADDCIVAVEGLVYNPRVPNFRSLIALAESTGELLGPIRTLCPYPIRPTASQWRSKMLKSPGRKRLEAEQSAVEQINLDLRGFESNIHVVEAAWIALFGKERNLEAWPSGYKNEKIT